ncbi:hypothetical protein ACQ4LE_007366 [Meloidogyne hapla]|uniref:BTB domain-containing protein n=1 Tax=Meloidogyne hapla TaxID=6305 RepID=A0A1I8C1W6_MELHA
MANFLRRLITKSRSNSPQKGQQQKQQQQTFPNLECEEDECCYLAGPSTIIPNHLPIQQQPDKNRRQNRGDLWAMNPSIKQSHQMPNHINQPLQLSPDSKRRSPPCRPSNKAHSPSSISRRKCSTGEDPGTSSQELLSPSLWPSSPSSTPWLRNCYSNAESATDSSQRPTSSQVQPFRIGCGKTEGEEEESPSALQLIAAQQQRNRSSSPRKAFGQKTAEVISGSRSRSPAKKQQQQWAKTLDYLQPQCRLEGCSAAILVEDVRFLVCKHQLSHSSDFFRALFLKSHALPMEGVRHLREDEYLIQVSSLRHPPQALQFQWFLETTVPSPMLRDISDDLLETCMRLCKRFAARGLEMRCTKFIKERVESKPPLMALCWLNWSFKHHFHRSVQEACFPVVARLSLLELEKHRQMLPEAVFADLLAMKLRTAYQQTSTVFHTIHRMDHFRVDMAQCPRCGRQREQGRIRVQASPCHKLIGCERCLREYQCELGDEDSALQMQAFWQCEHGLWPFSDKTEDCRCQTILYKTNWGGDNNGQNNQSPIETTINRQQQNKSPQLPSTFPMFNSPSNTSNQQKISKKPGRS